MARAASQQIGKLVPRERMRDLLHAVIAPGDRVCLEGNNQKQADYLAEVLAGCDPERLHHLHMLQSVLALPSHIDLFERGIASKVDFSFSGPQGARLSRLVQERRIEIGAIHTYLELFARYFVDLTPQVSLIAAEAADAQGNLYTGANTEDTPAIVEATAFRGGIVIAQVNRLADTLPRVDIPAGWVDFIVEAPRPNHIEPLFTRDPAQISDVQVLMAMMALKGIYAEYGVQRLNHGIGFDTAAIELLLPTYGESLGLKGKVCSHWALNPHPTLIPAIEAGWVQSIHCFGSEVGMERYVAARPDVFFTGADGSLRSNRAFSQTAGLYACDMFIGSTLQMDLQGNSSTATVGRITGFGGAPNMGSDPHGRRHATPAWLKAGREAGEAGGKDAIRGRKLVVQTVQTFREQMAPVFVESLDAWKLQEAMGADLPPIMIYGDDISHVVTEEGIANLLLCRTPGRARTGDPRCRRVQCQGLARDERMVENLRDRRIVRRPEDMQIDSARGDPRPAGRARSIKDLVRCSGHLYEPPARFRNW
ncbi:MAG: malonate decarboxylase subunit alpha [Rubrivivax sp.]